jgi:sortase A
VRIAGLVIMAAALVAIGYSAWNLISADLDTQESLQEAEQLIGEMDAYTGSPQATLSPDETLDPNGVQPEDTAIIPGDGNTGDNGGNPASSAVSGSNATAKPNSGGSKSSVIGLLVFNSLGGRKVPVLEGATAKELSRGAAHHPRSSAPGAVGNCVIFGHRNTVFRSFGKLKVGDTIRLDVKGASYTYAISSMEVVEPDDSRIFQAYSEHVMTLVTCYPFDFVGSAPHRYIVVAKLQ